MKKTLAIFLSVAVLVCAVPHVVFAATFTDDKGLTYTLNDSDKTATLTKGKNVNSVEILGQVNYNGTDYTVTTIGDSAFRFCSGLTSVTIPGSVTTIGKHAFESCNGLTSINVDSANPNFKVEDGVLFSKDGTSLILYPSAKTGNSYTIPDGVTAIGRSAFYECSGLTSVTIPESVTTIGSSAFYYCSGLTSITIPDSVTSIGESVFDGCRSLTSVTIPNSVNTIGGYVFQNCSKLTSVTIGSGVITIGKFAFYGCSKLASIDVDPANPNFKSADGVLFNKDVTKLILNPGGKTGSYTIPDSVTTIGEYAFQACSGLTSVEIPGSVTTIGEYAFSQCSGLTSITIPCNFDKGKFKNTSITVNTSDSSKFTNSAGTSGSFVLKHDCEDWAITREPTCTTAGEKTGTCTVCGTVTETIEPKPHSIVPVAEVKATCTKTGTRAHYKCSSCNTLFSDAAGTTSTTAEALTTDMLDHTLTHTPALDSTCVTEGMKEYWTCSKCHGIFSDSAGTTSTTLEALATDKADHTLTHHQALDSNCVTGGRKEYWTCSKCHGIFSDAAGTTSTNLEALATDVADHTLTHTPAVASTCVTKGMKEYWACSKCNGIFSDAAGKTSTTLDELKLEALGHDIKKVEKVESTCVKTGTKEHWECSRCHTLFSDENGETSVKEEDLTLPKLDHDWDAGEVTTAATPEKPGVKTYTCSRCGETKTEPVEYVSVPGGDDNSSTNLHPDAGSGDNNSTNSYSDTKVAVMAKRATIKTGDQMGIWVMFDMALLLLSAYGVLVGIKLRRKRYEK